MADKSPAPLTTGGGAISPSTGVSSSPPSAPAPSIPAPPAMTLPSTTNVQPPLPTDTSASDLQQAFTTHGASFMQGAQQLTQMGFASPLGMSGSNPTLAPVTAPQAQTISVGGTAQPTAAAQAPQPSPSPQAAQNQEGKVLKVEDALTYLDEVKRQFGDQPHM